MEQYNPVLLVKDFNSHGKLKTDDTFMTLADIPALLTEGIIDHPVNPITGNPIDFSGKEGGAIVSTADNFDPFDNDGYSYKTKSGMWYRVSGNIFDEKNWVQIDKPY